jgi:hypothetical protein
MSLEKFFEVLFERISNAGSTSIFQELAKGGLDFRRPRPIRDGSRRVDSRVIDEIGGLELALLKSERFETPFDTASRRDADSQLSHPRW